MSKIQDRISRLAARVSSPVVIFGAIAVFLIFITTFGSPLLLLLVSATFKLDESTWMRLSNIGQSFSGISAVLAAVALVALAYSSTLQARQIRIAQLQAIRSLQLETFKLAIADPQLSAAWGVNATNVADYERWRVRAYTNMCMMYIHTGFRAGEMTEAAVRRSAREELFVTSAVREFWGLAKDVYYTEFKHDDLGRRFVEIVNEEYEDAVSRARRSADLPLGDP